MEVTRVDTGRSVAEAPNGGEPGRRRAQTADATSTGADALDLDWAADLGYVRGHR